MRAKRLVPNLSFIEKKDLWGVYLQGSIRTIPEEDFRFIESEMKKVIIERPPKQIPKSVEVKTARDYEQKIMELPLQS